MGMEGPNSPLSWQEGYLESRIRTPGDGKEPLRAVPVSPEELSSHARKRIDDPELIDWAARKGIPFNKGFIEIEMSGEKMAMDTNTEDFGTVVDRETAARMTRLRSLEHQLAEMRTWERGWNDGDRDTAKDLEAQVDQAKKGLGRQ